ncbi:hypothetical protein OG21DRAFT_1505654, partial [Imleria badia]
MPADYYGNCSWPFYNTWTYPASEDLQRLAPEHPKVAFFIQDVTCLDDMKYDTSESCVSSPLALAVT